MSRFVPSPESWAILPLSALLPPLREWWDAVLRIIEIAVNILPFELLVFCVFKLLVFCLIKVLVLYLLRCCLHFCVPTSHEIDRFEIN